MGSTASKTAKTAAGTTVRKYPTRSPQTATTRAAAAAPTPHQPTTTPPPGPTVHPSSQASAVETESIDADAKDPGLASRLSSLGAVQPNPHYSPTSRSAFDPQPQPQSQSQALRQRPTAQDIMGDMMAAPPVSAFPDPRNNPVLRVLDARQKIQDEADEEMSQYGRKGFGGRKYLDVTLLQLAMMRQLRGEPTERIEEMMGLKKGRLGLLKKGTVGPVRDEF